ncbi:TolB-like protein [Litoreibacter ponti]|uniref:TolB-like protein n=1 Tax=Litoreibacter ponti TaxID=1510457 RepID=A0A2T6BES0_9RHOB|nr:hypothetical protein [Litoreibacter ponti]PTX54562.1 TolB-like protein [Litoreibacter ponti]
MEITGAKHRALFALLATAPLGRRTRSYLQQTLWGSSCYDGGRQNLRRALSDLRALFEGDFDEFVKCTNSDVELDLSKVNFLGAPGSGAFLEGMGIRDKGFLEWVGSVRADESQIAGLYRTTPRTQMGRPLPRVTALPFKRIMGGEQMSVLGDWLAEEVCRSLSRSNLLSVISHLSSRALAQRTTDLAQVREVLDVDYFITGSVREMGGRVVVDMDFVDARDANIIWTRQIEGPQASFWDEVMAGIEGVVKAIGRAIADEAITYIKDRPVPELDDHHLVIGGVSLMHRPTFRDFAKARTLLEEATDRAPMVAETHAWLSKWYVLSVFNGWTTDRAGDTQKALDNSARALDLNPDSSFALVIDGFAHNNLKRELDVASARYDAALDINPNESLSWLLTGALRAFQDRGAEAIASAEKARRLSPIDPFGYYYDGLTSTAYLAAEDYERALELANSSLAGNDRHLSTLRAKITALHYLGRTEEAKAVAEDMMRRAPDFRVDQYARQHPAAGHGSGKRVVTALAAAGVR